MKGTLTEPLIRPASPELSEEAAPTKDGGMHEFTHHGHSCLPSKDYEVSYSVVFAVLCGNESLVPAALKNNLKTILKEKHGLVYVLSF